jgi:hypothetical protein
MPSPHFRELRELGSPFLATLGFPVGMALAPQHESCQVGWHGNCFPLYYYKPFLTNVSDKSLYIYKKSPVLVQRIWYYLIFIYLMFNIRATSQYKYRNQYHNHSSSLLYLYCNLDRASVICCFFSFQIEWSVLIFWHDCISLSHSCIACSSTICKWTISIWVREVSDIVFIYKGFSIKCAFIVFAPHCLSISLLRLRHSQLR